MALDDIRRLLTACAGADGNAALAGDIMDTDFGDLGYDSLALMEMAARIEQERGVKIPDEVITELRTPRAVLETVNGGVVA
ncbi:acyl carrier protein [Allostreptomyces psammosilenae]|nr:acyl carrier protein [Allostreptomyces psammosilenae]